MAIRPVAPEFRRGNNAYYRVACPDCGVARLVQWQWRDRPCKACSYERRRQPGAMSDGKNTTFKVACPICAKVRPVRKGREAQPCRACGNQLLAKHGLSEHPLYGTWKQMIVRCTDAAHKSYRHYGRRGIEVCQEWRDDIRSFVSWAEANGWRPGLEIDRRDNDGNYEPSNCRLATRCEQMRNTRRTRITAEQAAAIKALILAGERSVEIAARFGIHKQVVINIKVGASWKDIVPAGDTQCRE